MDIRAKLKHKADAYDPKRILLDSSFQGVNELFILSYDNSDGDNKIHMNSPRRYALPRVNLTKSTVLIDVFYETFMTNQFQMK